MTDKAPTLPEAPEISLNHLRELSSKGSPAPWVYVARDNLIYAKGSGRTIICVSTEVSEQERDDNSALVTAMRNALPKLITYIDALLAYATSERERAEKAEGDVANLNRALSERFNFRDGLEDRVRDLANQLKLRGEALKDSGESELQAIGEHYAGISNEVYGVIKEN